MSNRGRPICRSQRQVTPDEDIRGAALDLRAQLVQMRDDVQADLTGHRQGQVVLQQERAAFNARVAARLDAVNQGPGSYDDDETPPLLTGDVEGDHPCEEADIVQDAGGHHQDAATARLDPHVDQPMKELRGADHLAATDKPIDAATSEDAHQEEMSEEEIALQLRTNQFVLSMD